MLLIAPAIILICSLLVYPVLYGVWLSLFKKHSFFPDQRFVGIANYVYLMKDSEFWMSVWYGTVYSVSTIVLQIIFGIIAALIVNEAFRGRNFVRGVILFPYVIPTCAASYKVGGMVCIRARTLKTTNGKNSHTLMIIKDVIM